MKFTSLQVAVWSEAVHVLLTDGNEQSVESKYSNEWVLIFFNYYSRLLTAKGSVGSHVLF